MRTHISRRAFSMSHQNDLHERKSLDDGSILLLFKAAGSGILDRLADTSSDYVEVPAAENANRAYAADWKPCVLRNPWGSSLSSAGTISQIASPGVNARMSLTLAVLKETGARARGWCVEKVWPDCAASKGLSKPEAFGYLLPAESAG